MKILLIEDDPLISREIIDTLSREGYLVQHESNGRNGWFAGDTEDFSAVILDLGLPGVDGLTILKKWRMAGQTFPVLVLTARGSWEERVEGIDAGADDYLPKPFQMAEMLARLRAIIRRSAGQASAILKSGDITLDTRTKMVSKANILKQLTPLEFRCLHLLMLNQGRAVSQMELTEQLYAQDFERESNSVEVLVGRLRKKLGRDVIQTRRGFGYIIPDPEHDDDSPAT
ncbi:MAG: response regulator transcription factor [Gammaproteobacteria bacterium]|nr:response regulator transcription factor [Gammaproteobacteria bacterium]